MRVWSLAVAGLILIASCLHGETFKLDYMRVGSITYSNVTVMGANATDLYFTHDKGMSNVKLKYLQPELQKRLNYDPKAAGEAEKKQAELDVMYQEGLAAKLQAAVLAEQAARAAREAQHTYEESLADSISEESLLGKQAPSFSVEKWISDEPVMEGKFVLLTFWAPWSIPCRKAIPELNALQKKFSEKLVVVGVSSVSEAEVADFNEPKLEFASAIDSKRKLCEAAGITCIPSVLLVDPKRHVIYEGHPGAINEKKLQALLNRPTE
jgi:cytochrome c biogenesis protein CcmG, thiol:disulfide interchange protein DsbE